LLASLFLSRGRLILISHALSFALSHVVGSITHRLSLSLTLSLSFSTHVWFFLSLSSLSAAHMPSLSRCRLFLTRNFFLSLFLARTPDFSLSLSHVLSLSHTWFLFLSHSFFLSRAHACFLSLSRILDCSF